VKFEILSHVSMIVGTFALSRKLELEIRTLPDWEAGKARVGFQP
jgi:hypothetical protein